MLNYYRPKVALPDVTEAHFCALSSVYHMTLLQNYIKWAFSYEPLLLPTELGRW